MIKSILIRDFRTFKGSNEIHLNGDLRLTAVLGPNGSGKSTILDALAIASGRSNFGDEDTDSVVGVALREGSIFRRCASGSCMVNNKVVSLEEYKEAATKTLRIFVTDSEFPWQSALQDPEKMLEYIEDLELPNLESFPADSQHSRAMYKSRVEDEKTCYERYKQVTRKLNKVKKELRGLEYAQGLHEALVNVRSQCREYRASLALHKMAKLKLRIKSIEASSHLNKQELQKTRDLLARDLEKLNEASTTLKTLEQEIILDRKENADLKSRIQSMETQQLVLQRKDKHRVKWDSEISTLETMVVGYYNISMEEVVDNLDEILTSRFSRDSDDLLLYSVHGLSEYLERARSDYRTGIAKVDQTFAAAIEETQSVSDQLIANKRVKQDLVSKIESEKRKQQEFIEPHIAKEPPTKRLDDNEVSSLKLLYPGVLGTLETFVKAKQDVDGIPSCAIESILREIADSKREIMLVVDSDERAIEYAKSVSTYKSRPVNFVTRKIPDIHPKPESVPVEIAREYPSACCLSSLLVTSSGDEEHLKFCLADRYLVLPSREACAKFAKRTSRGLCSSDGTHYRAPKEFSIDSFVITVGEDEEDDAGIAERQAQAQRQKDKIAAMEKDLEEVNKNIVCFKDSMDECMATCRMLKQQRARFLDACEKIRVEIDDASDFWQDFRRASDTSSREAVLSKWKSWCTDKLTQWSLALERHNSSIFADARSEEVPSQCELLSKPKDEALLLCESDRELADVSFRRDQCKLTIQRLTRQREALASKCDDLELLVSRAEHLPEQYKKDLERMMLAEGTSLARTLTGDSEYNEEFISQEIEKLLGTFDRSLDIWSIESQIDARIGELQRKISERGPAASRIVDDEPRRSRVQSLLETYESLKTESQERGNRYMSAHNELKILKDERNSRVQQNTSKLGPVFERVYYEMYDYVGRSSAQAHLKYLGANVDQGISVSAIPAGKPYCPVSNLSSGEKALVWLALQIAIGIVSGCNTIAVDEVDAHLDFRSALEMSRSLLRLTQASNLDLSVILVTHRRAVYVNATHLVGVFKTPLGSNAVACANRKIARKQA